MGTARSRSKELGEAGDALDLLRSGQRALRSAFEAGAPGPDLARRHASLLDEVLEGVFAEAALPGGWALVALGGYGRGELAPFSDIDLMLLHSGRARSAMRGAAESIFYPLWDAGLTVGNALRTVKQALDLARADLETLTALLDARTVAGDATLLPQLTAGIRRHLTTRGGRGFFDDLRQALAQRHDEFGRSAYLLEPHIKEGLGGLRDIQAIGWVGKGLLEAPVLDALVTAGHLTLTDAETLGAAHDFLSDVRTHLHYEAGRRQDRLTFDSQMAVAAALGYGERGDVSTAERFMTELFGHTGQVERVAAVFWERQATRRRAYSGATRRLTDDLVIHNGHIELVDPAAPAARPHLMLSLFAASVSEMVPVSSEAIQAIQTAVADGLAETAVLSPGAGVEARDAMLSLLRAGPDALPAMELLTQIDVFSVFIPEWSAIRSRAQFDAYHLWTVDMHALHTVAELVRLRSGGHGDEPLATELAATIEDWDTLLVAGLLHDLGKGHAHGHAERSAELAGPILGRLGFREDVARTVTYLVGRHLLLYDTATRRDLNDERVVVSTAQDIGSLTRARMLYLLTVADATATGPKAWTPWKSTLVAELTLKVLHTIESGRFTGRGAQSRAADAKAGAHRRLDGRYGARRVDAFLASMPPAYVMAVDADRIAEHFRLMEGSHPIHVRTAVHDGPRPGLYELIVVTKDEPDLFSTVAGALTLSGASIVSGESYVRSNGQALMVFSVTAALGEHIEPERWPQIERTITKALTGRIALGWRLAERAATYRGMAAPPGSRAPRVQVDNGASDFYTVVEVYARDRIGLLYTITSALHDLRLQVHQARISTAGDEAADVFYVLDRDGQKLVDDEQMAEVVAAVTHALAPEGTHRTQR